MIEAGIIAVAILIVGIAGIVVYRKEQAASRKSATADVDALGMAVSGLLLGIRETLGDQFTGLNMVGMRLGEVTDSLAPLCSGLAESLTARMSTIDADMADLRIRVETGPGKRTLRV